MTMSTTTSQLGSATSARLREGAGALGGNGSNSGGSSSGDGAGTSRSLRSAMGVCIDGGVVKVATVTQAEGGRFSVVTQEFAAEDHAGLKAAIERANTDGLAVVLAAGSCVVKPVRSAARPTGSADQIAAALGLMAEAEAPGQAPAHRRACVVVQSGKASNLLAIGWTKSELGSESKSLSLATLTGKRSGKMKGAYVPPVLALAGLVRGLKLDESKPGLVAAVSGKPGSPVSMIDALASGQSKDGEATLSARSTLASDQAGVQQALTQMAMAGGISPAQELTDESSTVRVFVPASAAAAIGTGQITGVVMNASANRSASGGTSQGTIGSHGLAIGAAIVLMQQRAAELPGLSMSLVAPGNRGPWWERVLTWPGTPLRLGIASAVGLAVIGGAWLGSSMLQASFLKQQLGLAGEAKGDDRSTQRAMAQSEWFRLQREYRVPVASILAELAGTAPAGVTIENLAIDQAFPNTGRVITVTLSGTSPSAETVNQWRSELLKRGTFSEVPGPTVDESVQPARYTLTPRLSDVMKLAAAKVKPLPPIAPARTVNADDAKPATPRVNEPPAPSPAPAATTPNRPAGTGATTTAAPEIPPALTDAQIAAMTSREAMNQWARRRGLIQNPVIEAEVKSRLEDELRKIDARRTELRSQPATPPASGATP